MSEAEVNPGPGTALPAARAFELRTGTEFVVFLAEQDGDLPGDSVRRELRVAARHGRNTQTRGIVDTIISEGTAGIVGGAAWAGIATTLTATARYLRNRRQPPAVSDVATVAARLKTACEQIIGTAPDIFSGASVQRLEDGCWAAEFTYGGLTVYAILDPSCSIVSWTQE